MPNCQYLLAAADLETPPIGFYDTPEPEAFAPLVRPQEGRWACLFMFYNSWRAGKSLHLTSENYGCGGCGTYLLGQSTRSRKEYLAFLHGEEALKATPDLIGEWMDSTEPYRPKHGHLVIGPLREERYSELRTVTFLINPDQLSLFVTGAYYQQGPNQPPRVTAPFASGCGLLAPVFEDLEIPQAVIGATDIAMRKYLPPELLAFTVTKPLFEQLCALNKDSFLNKPFWEAVKKSRK